MLNLEQTCNNPHPHSLARTVIRTKLSAWACQPFCCQRTFYPSRSECPECLRTCLAGLTGSLSCELAFQFCRKIKNPASSAGRNHPHLGGSTRCSTSFYPVLVKNPTIGSASRLRFSRAGRFLRSDCDAPEQSSAPLSSRTIRNNTSFSSFVKPSKQLFRLGFPQPCGIADGLSFEGQEPARPSPGGCTSIKAYDPLFWPLTYWPGASKDTRPGPPRNSLSRF
jgi:hypothetical protein